MKNAYVKPCQKPWRVMANIQPCIIKAKLWQRPNRPEAIRPQKDATDSNSNGEEKLHWKTVFWAAKCRAKNSEYYEGSDMESYLLIHYS